MADPLDSWHPLCALCGSEMLPEQELNEDHVFGRALGGRVTLTVHEACNSQSGSAAEGSLQPPNSVFNLMKAVKGLDSSRVRGAFPSGRQAHLNLKDGSVYSPPIKRMAQDGTALSIEGTPAEA